MPARGTRTLSRATLIRTGGADGLMVAPIRPAGRWGALRALHQGMQRLREAGAKPALAFVIALAEDGRIVRGRDPAAAMFVLGYRSG